MIQAFNELTNKQRFKIWNQIQRECKETGEWFHCHSWEELCERFAALNTPRADVPQMTTDELNSWFDWHYRELTPASVEMLHKWKDSGNINVEDKTLIEASNALLANKINDLVENYLG